MMKVEVDTLNTDGLMADVMRAAKRSAMSIAHAQLKAHRDAIDSGKTPDGSSQPGKKKDGKPPLYDKGRLRDNLVVSVDERGTVTIRPPGDRVKVLEELQTKGYRTIFDEPADVEAQKLADEEVAKIQVARYVRK